MLLASSVRQQAMAQFHLALRLQQSERRLRTDGERTRADEERGAGAERAGRAESEKQGGRGCILMRTLQHCSESNVLLPSLSLTLDTQPPRRNGRGRADWEAAARKPRRRIS